MTHRMGCIADQDDILARPPWKRLVAGQFPAFDVLGQSGRVIRINRELNRELIQAEGLFLLE